MSSNQPNFHVYVPVGVTARGRDLFRTGTVTCMRKFADAERKHRWKDAFVTASKADIMAGLHEHIAKGDPRDVIIFCLILIYRGWRIE